MNTGRWHLELFLSKQCGVEEEGRPEGGWWSTCIFVQTLSLVMSSLDSKHLSVFYNGNPDPESLANIESIKETTIWGLKLARATVSGGSVAVLNLLKRGRFIHRTCNELFLVSCKCSEGQDEDSSLKLEVKKKTKCCCVRRCKC